MVIKKLLEWLYPTICPFCEEICKEGVCSQCRNEIPLIQEPRCKRCGKPIHLEEEEYCYDCRKRKHFFEQGRSLWLHRGKVKQAIYAFKYKNRRFYGEIFGREMGMEFESLLKLWEIDIIVPVPLHKKKKRKRGFNQAEVIAKELSLYTGIPMDTSIVLRKRETAPQKEFGQKDRKKNLRNAFEVISVEQIIGKNVLIIDDIYTTGSTIDAISRKLVESGGKKPYFLTISIGQGF